MTDKTLVRRVVDVSYIPLRNTMYILRLSSNNNWA